ncbi:hypothetical protein BCR43DRAFT_499195 [Syncephalastrum racemosum]|uniref:Protein Zds1 C-terminal domain-containing protein n=1 Tax=Syncephalastrum racemosum TaxID=13706 RepID=A0A1X2H038_SYNRA|nr:hypothetical protein BCR43DRAFT_499195 [Syncephalastrum racemosum]
MPTSTAMTTTTTSPHGVGMNGVKQRDDDSSAPSHAEGNGQHLDDTPTKEDEKEDTTQKTDSGVYLAMMLSEYLDRTAPNNNNNNNKNTLIGNDTVETQKAAQEGGNDVARFENQQPDANSKDANHNSNNSNSNQNNTDNNDGTTANDTAETVTELSNLIWVPAHKHPQIAPSEFVNWLEVHGASPTRRDSKIKRQKSRLNRSVSACDLDEDDTTTSSSSDSPVSPSDAELPPFSLDREKDHPYHHDHAFSRQSTSTSTSADTSPVLAAPTQNRALLRRSAFSARRRGRDGGGGGETRSKNRRGSRHTKQQEEGDDDEEESERKGIPGEGVSLYDRPVSLSEFIDFGSSGFEGDSQHGILSRVHDAESLYLTPLQQQQEEQEQKEKQREEQEKFSDLSQIREEPEEEPASEPEEKLEISSALPAPLSTPPSSPTSPVSEPPLPESGRPLTPKRPSFKRFSTQSSSASSASDPKIERKSSWLGGLLGDKKKKRRNSVKVDVDGQHNNKLTRGNSTHSTASKKKKKGGLASLMRTFSLKSSKKDELSPAEPTCHRLEQPYTMMPRQYIHSYRLPIHVERAVYRLSHMKLANPRRPLHQQVVISNFMFWYLSIINPSATQQPSQPQPHNPSPHSSPSPSSKEQPQTPFDENIHHHHHHPHTTHAARPSYSQAQTTDAEDDVPLSFYHQSKQ